MAEAARVADMSVEDLEALIARMIDQRLRNWPERPLRTGQALPEVWQSILNDILELAPGQPTPLELLREERDQWYKNT